MNVSREPSAVVASLLAGEFWKKRLGLHKPFWKNAMGADTIAMWEETGRSPIALAALQWCSVFGAKAKERLNVNARYSQVHYEQFIEARSPTMNRIFSFCGLRQSKKINAYISSRNYSNMNYKFLQNLSHDDVLLIERIAGDKMRSLGYM